MNRRKSNANGNSHGPVDINALVRNQGYPPGQVQDGGLSNGIQGNQA
jgi:hypothetical protein